MSVSYILENILDTSLINQSHDLKQSRQVWLDPSLENFVN